MIFCRAIYLYQMLNIIELNRLMNICRKVIFSALRIFTIKGQRSTPSILAFLLTCASYVLMYRILVSCTIEFNQRVSLLQRRILPYS